MLLASRWGNTTPLPISVPLPTVCLLPRWRLTHKLISNSFDISFWYNCHVALCKISKVGQHIDSCSPEHGRAPRYGRWYLLNDRTVFLTFNCPGEDLGAPGMIYLRLCITPILTMPSCNRDDLRLWQRRVVSVQMSLSEPCWTGKGMWHRPMPITADHLLA